MSEQSPGVEDFDPDIALDLILEHLEETYDELWNGRFNEAAFGAWQALDGELPADGSEYERARLDASKDYVCELIGHFKQRGLIPMLFDPETEATYPIIGLGYNVELLSLVAQVFDPQDPASQVTKLIGPGTGLAYIEQENVTDPFVLESPGFNPQIELAPPLTGGFIGRLPFMPQTGILE